MPLVKIVQKFFSDRITAIRIAWIKYWALQRRFTIEHTTVSFRRALFFFVVVLLLVYFVIGLPILGYMVYGKKSDQLPLSLASTLYPFPIATVGQDVILLKPYSDRLHYLTFFAKQTQQTLPSSDDLRNQVVTKLIDEAVVRQWANKEGIVVTKEDIDAAYAKIVKDRGSEGDVQTVLSQLYNLSDVEFKRLIPDLLYREKVERTIIEQVQVSHILVSSETLAKKIRGEVDATNFSEKAKQYSEDKTTRDTGGELGSFDHGRSEKLDPALAKVFFELQPGQISDPIKTQYGYHLVFLVSKSGSVPMTFDQWLEQKRGQTKIHRFLK